MDNKDLEQFIKKQGWSMFGIADFKDIKKNLKRHEKIFEEWVGKGFGADMDYLKKMKKDRFNPALKLPDVKSVIVLGAWYAPDLRFKIHDSRNSGLIARYARGRDYHKILKKKLIELSDWLKSQLKKSNVNGQRSNVETYVSVDSGPVVDRVLAESVGLGFFGKNSCIINPSRGSFFFIASLLTNLELEPTPKKRMPNCGNCQKCIQNCPMGAIVSPGVVDARKCISYLTIENKGGIPEDLRLKIGNHIFGCDACQEICPFNVARAGKQEITIERLKGECGVGEYLDLRDVFSIKSDEEFLKKFAGTPLMRAKRRGLIRNACVVAGNSGNKELIPFLQKIIDLEYDDILKKHAEWAIKNILTT